MRTILIFCIRGYQVFSAALWRYRPAGIYYFPCRFNPTCSEYAIESLQNHGVLKGSWRALVRIAHCNPLFASRSPGVVI